MTERSWGWKAQTVFVGLGLAVVLLAACGGEPTGLSGLVSVDRFFSGAYATLPASGAPSQAKGEGLVVALAGAGSPTLVEATLVEGVRPDGAGEAAATLDLQSSIITGMPAKLLVSGDAPFDRLALGVEGAENYWEIVLPYQVTSVQVIVTGSSSVPNAQFAVEAAVGSAAGFGAPARQGVEAVDLANSDIAVVLRWNAPSDVDLHVTDGKGVKVYFANPTTPEGGRLDLDSNPACDIDGVNQEVVTWPIGKAPIGEYKIEVDYWSDCGVPRTDYSVTYMVKGQTLQVLDGFFEGQPEVTRHELARFSFP